MGKLIEWLRFIFNFIFHSQSYRNTHWHEKIWRGMKENPPNSTWKENYFNSTINHPHKKLIIDALARFKFGSVLEVGCNIGVNLYLISKIFKRVEVGGIDINAEAIEEAKKIFPKYEYNFQVGIADSLFFSDKSIDMILTDACLIYIGKDKINKVIKEMARVARKGIVLCEYHTKNPFKAWVLKRVSGYYAHDYEKLLKKYGFWDITIRKIKENEWPGGGYPWGVFGYIISATCD